MTDVIVSPRHVELSVANVIVKPMQVPTKQRRELCVFARHETAEL